MSDCVFCANREKGVEAFELPRVRHFFYQWDINPVTPGHLLIIPKRHVADFMDLSTDEQSELVVAVRQGYEAIKRTNLADLYQTFLDEFANEKSRSFIIHALEQLERFPGKPDGFNHGLNDGRAAGRTVDHMHYHLMPRWTGDVGDPRGGIRHMFQGKGNYHKGLAT
jgi:diadenosine tetraphosphate (Ap4A) HIT family hydrolase